MVTKMSSNTDDSPSQLDAIQARLSAIELAMIKLEEASKATTSTLATLSATIETQQMPTVARSQESAQRNDVGVEGVDAWLRRHSLAIDYRHFQAFERSRILEAVLEIAQQDLEIGWGLNRPSHGELAHRVLRKLGFNDDKSTNGEVGKSAVPPWTNRTC